MGLSKRKRGDKDSPSLGGSVTEAQTFDRNIKSSREEGIQGLGFKLDIQGHRKEEKRKRSKNIPTRVAVASGVMSESDEHSCVLPLQSLPCVDASWNGGMGLEEEKETVILRPVWQRVMARIDDDAPGLTDAARERRERERLELGPSVLQLLLLKLHNKNVLQRQNVRPTVDEHVLAKKIELSSNQSNGEDLSLDEPISKEEITLSINGEVTKAPEVEAIEIMDNHCISKINGVHQELEFEDRTEQSILEEENDSNTDGEPQFHMKVNQGANFPMRDVYVDTCQMLLGYPKLQTRSISPENWNLEDSPGRESDPGRCWSPPGWRRVDGGAGRWRTEGRPHFKEEKRDFRLGHDLGKGNMGLSKRKRGDKDSPSLGGSVTEAQTFDRNIKSSREEGIQGLGFKLDIQGHRKEEKRKRSKNIPTRVAVASGVMSESDEHSCVLPLRSLPCVDASWNGGMGLEEEKETVILRPVWQRVMARIDDDAPGLTDAARERRERGWSSGQHFPSLFILELTIKIKTLADQTTQIKSYTLILENQF
ncbi:hypothetical protein ACLB2K_052560 [Fragaria x ananassa]